LGRKKIRGFPAFNLIPFLVKETMYGNRYFRVLLYDNMRNIRKYSGKSIVTANKELFSKHWAELEEAAKEGNAGLYFEASCVGGVPIIRTLEESMQGNEIRELKGIINGTTNYILTKMSEEGESYEDALAGAQRLGYAEYNPTADVDGYDASYKLSILSTLAYNKHIDISHIYREGISKVKKEDIAYGKELGLTLKLLAISKMYDGKVEARVHPTFISDEHPLASVRGAFNAVFIVGNNVGDIMLYGRGAGDLPTGSAIVSDIVYAATKKKHTRYPALLNKDAVYVDDFKSEYYLRLTVENKCGVLAKIAGAFAKFNVSITTVTQKKGDENTVPITFITERTHEKSVNSAVENVLKIPEVVKIENVIRVER
jgi:homoserine dehydrogenase